MKKTIKSIVLLLIIVFLLVSCGNKSYVVFNYNCNGTDYHKCELKNNKLNCSVETPSCGEYKFKGWFRANEYNNPVDLSSNFTKNEIIYARWEKESGIIESSSKVEPTSTIVTPGTIDIPSSSKEEPSSSQQQVTPPTPVNPPKPEETYTISFNLNGGTGGQTSPISGVKYNNDLPKINQTKPTKPGYTFMGWYDKTTGGTQYYNSSNSPVRKYDKKGNITLYAHWTINTLSIEYNGNGGSWNSSNSTYGVNGSNTVIVKSTNQVYQKVLNYGEKLESSGLTDYNGSWFKWTRSGYTVESKKEYIIGSTVIDQNKVYSAVELSRYGGCDLSKTNCTIIVKVNWNEYFKPEKPLAGENVTKIEETETLKVYVTEASTYYLTRIWAKNPYMQFSKQDAKPYGKTRKIPSKLLENAIDERNLSNKLVLGFNASGFYLAGQYDADSVNYNSSYDQTSVGTLLITNGSVIRNAYSKGDLKTWFITGIDKNNKMVIFEDTKFSQTNANEKKAWADRVIASGIRNTYTFSAPIILDGKEAPYKPSYSRMPGSNYEKIGLQLFCQINENNFALFTTSNETRNKGINVLLSIGCQTAVNLDGGGSIALLFKPSNSTQIQKVVGNRRSLPEAAYISEE